MNRLELQQLADDRIADAAALLAAGRWSGAYYMAGYAVECALKACIAKLTKEFDFPRERKFVEDCYTHDLVRLLQAAGLEKILPPIRALTLTCPAIGALRRRGGRTAGTSNDHRTKLKRYSMRSQATPTESCRGYDNTGE